MKGKAEQYNTANCILGNREAEVEAEEKECDDAVMIF